MKNFIKTTNLLLLAVCMLGSCKGLVHEPQNNLDSDKAIVSAAGARAAIYGAYRGITDGTFMGLNLVALPELHGGNLQHTGTFPSYAEIANRSILTNNAEVTNTWIQIYNAINRINNIIEQVPTVKDPELTDAQKTSYIAEARFLRAFAYFNLVRYWGGVPLILTSTKTADASLQVPRSTVEQVYTQILADIDFAIANLPTYANQEKGRTSQSASYALKARVHLYRKQWNEAIAAATTASTGFTLNAAFTNNFSTKNSTESILELQYDPTNQTQLSFYLFSSTNGGRNEVRPSTNLINSYSTADTRRMLSTSYDVKVKYYRISTRDDDVILFRLAEMILIRAEALTELSGGANLQAAYDLLNQIRNRAGIGNAPTTLLTDQVALRNEIFLQRRLELALEGHYFFDLVRTGRAATTFPNWNDNLSLWPIPLREINANPQLKQNDGY